MSRLDRLMALRLRQEFLNRIDVIVTVAEAGRTAPAARLYAELTRDLDRYRLALEQDSKYVRLYAMLSALEAPGGADETLLDHARRRLANLRHADELEQSLQRLFFDR